LQRYNKVFVFGKKVGTKVLLNADFLLFLHISEAYRERAMLIAEIMN
jgi:hypothetical protein